MGFQVTILLSYVIYIDMLQSSVPVFDSFGSSPLIMQFFVVSSIILCICMLGTDDDVIMNHNQDDDVIPLTSYYTYSVHL